MSRDFEIHLYFEHQPLTATLLDPILGDLAAAGLRLGGPRFSIYPATEGFVVADGRPPRAAIADLDPLLRSKPPPVGTGYGILPFTIVAPDLPAASAFLSFSRPDRSTGLDGLSLVVDGAAFLRNQAAALDAAYTWFGVLCSRLDVLFGWADWETATFLVAAPSRRDIRAGVIPRLLRFNAVAPALFGAIDLKHLEAHAPRFQRLANGLVTFETGRESAREP